MKKHYDVLGLNPEATSDEVKRAYRDLSKKYHPDLCVAISKEIAEEKFKEINEAYAMIKKHLKRANNIENPKEESSKNEKNKYNIEMIYDLVQKYIAETQLKASSLKFPSKDTLSFLETDSFLIIEGYFFSKNWIDQKIKTSYRVSLFKNFKLDKLEFLKTEIITEKENRRPKDEKTYRFKKKNENYVLNFKHIFLFAMVILLFWLLLAPKGNDSFSSVSKITETGEKIEVIDKINETIQSVSKENSSIKEISYEDNYLKTTLDTLKEKKDVDNELTRDFYLKLASKNPGSYNVSQIAYIYTYLYTNWKYVNDPTGREYFAKASESIKNGLVGDCDDFAILLASCIEGIGGRARIVFAQNPTEGHAYTELRIADNEEEAKKIMEGILNSANVIYGQNLQSSYNYRKGEDGVIWMNLDWTSPTPGGEYFEATKEVVFDTLANSYFIAK